MLSVSNPLISNWLSRSFTWTNEYHKYKGGDDVDDDWQIVWQQLVLFIYMSNLNISVDVLIKGSQYVDNIL